MLINIVDVRVEKKDPNTRRTRKMLGDVSQLAESIKKHGLLHPIIVDGEPEGGWKLVAGERRLRACILNGSKQIEAKPMSDLDDVTSKEIELEENIVRKNLSWMEECEALRQLDELKKTAHGRAQPGTGEGGWKIADTAESVGIGRAAVAQDIKLAKDLLDNPELVKRVEKLPKTAARKIVRQEIEAAMLKRQVERNEVTISSNLMLGDACELIDDVKDESVHLLITDPPFGVQDIIDVGTMGSMTYNKVAKTNVSTPEVMRAIYKKLLPKVFKKLIVGGHIYIFLGMGWYTELIHMLRETGFIVDDLPLIWDKGRPSMIAKDIHYVSTYEAVLFGHKPPITRVLRKPVSNVLRVPTIAPQKRIHSLQKPFDLLKLFIENSSNPGELVLDCFAGSASTLVAAEKLQRSAIGFEIDSNNYLRAQKFMREELKC